MNQSPLGLWYEQLGILISIEPVKRGALGRQEDWAEAIDAIDRGVRIPNQSWPMKRVICASGENF